MSQIISDVVDGCISSTHQAIARIATLPFGSLVQGCSNSISNALELL